MYVEGIKGKQKMVAEFASILHIDLLGFDFLFFCMLFENLSNLKTMLLKMSGQRCELWGHKLRYN